MENSIEIERLPYEEPYHLNLIVRASNEYSYGQLEIYDKAESLNDIANALNQFPRHATDSVLWEIGSERAEDNFGFYFRFRLFLREPMKQPAIQIRMNNNAGLPDKIISEFCIPCDQSGVHNLAMLFKEFAELESRKLIWDGFNGEIIR